MNTQHKYYKEMNKMRFVDGMGLQEIGDVFKLSRERVRQIIGNTGRLFRTKWTEKYLMGIKNINKHLDEMGIVGTKGAWRNHLSKNKIVLGGWPEKGNKAERLASKILSKYGIKNELMPYLCGFDLKTNNGSRIDVKSVYVKLHCPSQYLPYSTYQVSNMKSGKNCDFFFIFIPDRNGVIGKDFFVIPSWEVHDLSHTSRIKITWPKGKKTSKWNKYYKRIDLII